jgi:hypothetical protein
MQVVRVMQEGMLHLTQSSWMRDEWFRIHTEIAEAARGDVMMSQITKDTLSRTTCAVGEQ